MVEYTMTGYLKGSFVNQVGNTRVMNFFVKSDGYQEEGGKYVNYEYVFETWMGKLIDKILAIPREEIVTVTFSIVPKKVPLEGGKKGNYNVLKANNIAQWKQGKKVGGPNQDEGYVQIEFGIGSD